MLSEVMCLWRVQLEDSCRQCLSFSLCFKVSSFEGKVWNSCPGRSPVCDLSGVCREKRDCVSNACLSMGGIGPCPRT